MLDNGLIRGRAPINFYKVTVKGVLRGGQEFSNSCHTIAINNENACEKAECIVSATLDIKVILSTKAVLLFNDIVI
jgi:hypothetical protein